MKIPVSPELDPSRAAFQTHLNYAKRIDHLLSECGISVTLDRAVGGDKAHVDRFLRLYKVTQRSIKKDMELAREDHTFAVIAAPWFPVKCYYALYYLESVLAHLLSGTTAVFSKGGHKTARSEIYNLLTRDIIVLSVPELDRVYILDEILKMPPIDPGRNARSTFWGESACTESMLKKLVDYKLLDAKIGNKWNLRRFLHRSARADFISRERLACLDFFYWYRIKANYRDLDFIDFENGITADDIMDYMEAYYSAYSRYRSLLFSQIGKLQHPPTEALTHESLSPLGTRLYR